MAVSTADKSKPYIPLSGCAEDGWSKEDEATATCFCGAVQLAFVSLPLDTAPYMSRPSRLPYCLLHFPTLSIRTRTALTTLANL